MTAGRPTKPTAQKVVQGNPGKRRLNEGEVKPAPAVSLQPPWWLMPAGRRVWRDLAPLTFELGLLTEADVELFGHACAQLAIARVDPHNHKALDAANKILARFGFTPSDRAKLSVKPQTKDPFEDFLTGKKAL